jgi:dolichol-phosphate mannosyltransferase
MFHGAIGPVPAGGAGWVVHPGDVHKHFGPGGSADGGTGESTKGVLSRAPSEAPRRPLDLSVVLPTYNERACLEAVTPRLETALRPYGSEIIVVDDNSPDGTAEFVRRLEPMGLWRLVSRDRPRGLASAVEAGFEEARGDVILVMDADGSHPPEVIPRLVEPVRTGRAELALASRFLPGGSDEGLHGYRKFISSAAAALARPLTPVTDPMSGFFAVRRSVLRGAELAPVGYKIGLEVLVKCRPEPILEVPFVFERRLAGESKLGALQVASYLRHLGRLYAWRYLDGGRAPSTR